MRPRTLNEITITTGWPYEGARMTLDEIRDEARRAMEVKA